MLQSNRGPNLAFITCVVSLLAAPRLDASVGSHFLFGRGESRGVARCDRRGDGVRAPVRAAEGQRLVGRLGLEPVLQCTDVSNRATGDE